MKSPIFARPSPLVRLARLVLLAAAATAHAEEIAVLGGQLNVNTNNAHSFAAALVYTHPAGEYTALSLMYLNEGHPQDHHRDGIGGQFWLHTKPIVHGLAFGVGVGEYCYFDTARTATGDYANDHGWGNMLSASVTWNAYERWYGKLIVTKVYPHGKDATTSLLAGFGYRFDGVTGDKLHMDGRGVDQTITVSAGQTIVNSFESQRSRGSSIEYRRAVAPYVDWTVTAIKEGTSALADRSGVATQAWLIRSLTHNVEMGMGVGPYAVLDLPDVQVKQSHLAGLVSIALRFHFNKRLVSQVIWHRVVTDYHRDADLLQIGLGANF
jgi:hypothetical protein